MKPDPKTKHTAPAPAAPDATEPSSPATEALAPPPPPTAEEIEDLRARAAKADEHWDRLLRTTADFENFKKRAARERQEAVKYANEALITKMVGFVDNLDMALAAARNPSADSVKSLQAGVEMICQQLKALMRDAGLEEVDATGQAFDPNLHEAVAQVESPDVPEGRVVQQLRKGYRLQGRLLRAASVVVAKAPAVAPAAGASSAA